MREVEQGYRQVYDADLQGYFDSIPHDKLMAALRMRVVDRSESAALSASERGLVPHATAALGAAVAVTSRRLSCASQRLKALGSAGCGKSACPVGGGGSGSRVHGMRLMRHERETGKRTYAEA